MWNCLNGTYELESRFGVLSNEGFVAGVSKRFFESTLDLFEKSNCWDKVIPWKEYVDYFYVHGGSEIRTSSFSENSKWTVTHIRKQKCDQRTIRLLADNYNVAFRVSIAFEEVVDAKLLPRHITPTYVRIKSRKQFIKNNWRFDFTRVWHGTNKLEAEMDQSINEGVFELECECIDPAAYIKELNSADDLLILATSFILKMVDLVLPGRYSLKVIPKKE